ncbi:class I adenylate-forming enzyme family protein [Agromyces albus]|uniref:class I adenylate-forming enzyme family protein n=1 Tax=Agromyces albus TaxID=205332 RepID=UPI0027861F24|nr:AMP-binding protein [Agromyces albus]MDQ0575823.1 long-chain acyl-CoA synthetase [Agromyces albus]
MIGWLDGDGEAIRFTGRSLSRAELRRLVASVAEQFDRSPGPVLAHDADPVAQLVTVLAALEAKRVVVVADPAQAAPVVSSLPPGTELVLMTSGSSGNARPVARTLASWTASFEPFTGLTGACRARRDDRTEPPVIAITGPLHVSMQLFAALHALWSGAVLVDDLAGADLVHATPTTLERLVSLGHRPRRVVVAGSALPPSTLASARAAGIGVTEYYGAAELSFVAAVDHSRDDAEGSGALGPFPGVEVDVRAGELWARSPYLSLGYAGVDGPFRRDAHGFATVGDRADAAPNGSLVVRGRGDSAVTVSGTTVLAEDVEAALTELAGVRAAAVIAVPHALHGHVPVAVLELAASADRARIITEARSRLTAPELPRRWYAIESLPRTTSGKVARAALGVALAAGALDDDRFGRA